MSQEPQDIFDRIRDQVKADEIVLYMKGSPAMPQCGFSQVTSEILRRLGREFASYDVLQDPALRQATANWGKVFCSDEYIFPNTEFATVVQADEDEEKLIVVERNTSDQTVLVTVDG